MVNKMTIKQLAAVTLTLVVAACGQKQSAAPENQTAATEAAAPAASDKIYSGSGTVKSITGNQMTIAHGPIASIGWPAMTMAYTAEPGLESGVKAGDQVDFSFKKNGGAYVLTSVKRR